ncbi:NifU family protein [Wenjunlia tyrosinilytica]|uniref:Rieske domain-containing protein n=1 Tax=Wenjunlia tyrosinilytica TaxID=1544741 RepID=A0A917ZP63_9ACTN|nr:NifU family protein [Wenjunlia tyrosinilytica]GGO87927.1 hypothetical protein GCM10012280_27530 [Wenjunlia tyrosinilytica]
MGSAAKEQQQAGERISALLDELDRTAGPAVRDTADELVRQIVEFYGAGLARIVELMEAREDGAAALEALTHDELVAGLLVLHDLHPDDTMTRVQKALDEVRPYLGSHAGDVEVVGLDPGTGVLTLRLSGSCDGCPSSTQTVRWTIEGAVARAAPEVAAVEVEGVTDAPGNPELLQIMSGPPGTASASSATAPPASPPSAGEGEARWHTLTGPLPSADGETAVHRVEGLSLLVVRLPGNLYAYRDHCPACGHPVHDGTLDGSELVCPGCSQRYDVRRAGRGSAGHLEPVPLLEQDGTVRVALPAVLQEATT